MPDSTSRRLLAAHTLLVALLCSLPHWIAIAKNHGDYSPFSVSPAVSALTFDETHAYAPPARRFMETGHIPAEVDNFERRGLSAGIPFIPAAILGAMGWTLRSLERAFIAADFIFPALLFLLYFEISREAVSAFRTRLLVAWFAVLLPFGLKNTFWLGDDAFLAPLELTRTPQPEISFPLLILAVILLVRALRERASSASIVAAGVASGVVVYSYYYYAVAWGITLGFLLLGGFYWRRMLVVISLMVLIAIPFVLATAKGKTQGGQTYLLERMGAFTHRPDRWAFLAALALTFVLLFHAKHFRRRYPTCFVLSLLIAGALFGMNFQVISGFETQPWHFWKRLALPVAFLLGAIFFAHSFPRLRLAAELICVLLIASTAVRLTIAALRSAPHQLASDPKLQLLVWARSHLPANRVIGTTDPQLILLIPAFTTDYTYVPSGLRSLTPTAEIVSRYDELACLAGFTPEDVAKSAAIPNHLGHSTQLMQVLGLTYTGDAAVERSFVEQYAAASKHCQPPRNRLDYLALPLARPAAHAIYRNSEYQLFAQH